MKVPITKFSVLYNSKNITADVAKYMLSITYKDKTGGESDDIEIELEDVDALWENSWYPEKGAKLTVTIGSLKCGVFQIDEIELKGPPATVTIKGIATGITNTLRTKKSDAHENKSLRKIAETVAAKNNLTIQGDVPEIDIIFGRVTQNKETDLAFLNRLSKQYGVVFSVRDTVMTFTSVYKLEERAASFTIDKTDIASWSLKDKADGMIKAAKVASKNAKENSSVSSNLEFEKYKKDNPTYTAPPVESQDSYVDSTKTENTQQADAKAKAIMHLSASNQQEGNISMEFHPLAVAGNNFLLNGMGKLSGKFHITASTHKIDKGGGATTECEIKRLQMPTKSAQVSKKKVKAQPKNVPVQSIYHSGLEINPATGIGFDNRNAGPFG